MSIQEYYYVRSRKDENRADVGNLTNIGLGNPQLVGR